MGIIIDANCCAKALGRSADVEFVPVLKALLRRKRTLHYGGTKLLEEYGRVATIRPRLLELDRAGIAKRHSSLTVDEKQGELEAACVCASDDPHIVALAIISGAKILCSHDQMLHGDFKKIAGGAIYQTAEHAHLL